jgi:hypothetical protein
VAADVCVAGLMKVVAGRDLQAFVGDDVVEAVGVAAVAVPARWAVRVQDTGTLYQAAATKPEARVDGFAPFSETSRSVPDR